MVHKREREGEIGQCMIQGKSLYFIGDFKYITEWAVKKRKKSKPRAVIKVHLQSMTGRGETNVDQHNCDESRPGQILMF